MKLPTWFTPHNIQIAIMRTVAGAIAVSMVAVVLHKLGFAFNWTPYANAIAIFVWLLIIPHTFAAYYMVKQGPKNSNDED